MLQVISRFQWHLVTPEKFVHVRFISFSSLISLHRLCDPTSPPSSLCYRPLPSYHTLLPPSHLPRSMALLRFRFPLRLPFQDEENTGLVRPHSSNQSRGHIQLPSIGITDIVADLLQRWHADERRRTKLMSELADDVGWEVEKTSSLGVHHDELLTGWAVRCGELRGKRGRA